MGKRFALGLERESVPEEPGREQYVARARRDIVRGSIWTLTATMVTMPVALVANVIVARSLGSEGLGRFATYTAVFAIAMVAANLGWSEATVQWLASASARDEQDERRALISHCAGFHLIVSGPLSALCAFLLLLLSGVSLAVAVASAVVVLLINALGTSTVINTATARNAVQAQIVLLVNLASQAGIVVVALTTHQPGLTWAVLLLMTLLGPALAALRLDADDRRALFRPRLKLRAPSGFWTYAISACVGGLVATLVFGRSELLILRANGLLAAAGVFTVITGLATQLTTPLDSIMAPLTPIAAGLMAVDRDRAIRLLGTSLRVTSVLSVIGTCIFVPIGVVAIRPFYGPSFSSAAAPFAVLGLVSCTQTVLGPLTSFAFATRSAPRVLRINTVSLAVDAVLAISLIPLIGLWGAVAANAAAQVLSLCWVAVLVAKRLDLELGDILQALPLFAAGISVGALEALLCLRLHGLQALAVVPTILFGLALLRMLLRRIHWLRIRPEDVAQLQRASSGRMMRWLVRALILARITDPE